MSLQPHPRRALRRGRAIAMLTVALAAGLGATPALADDGTVTVTIPPTSASDDASAGADAPSGTSGTAGSGGNSATTSPGDTALATTGVGEFAVIGLVASGVALAAGGALLLTRSGREDS
jgi:hypothetical protein